MCRDGPQDGTNGQLQWDIWARGHQTIGRSQASGWKNPKDERRERRSRAPTKGAPVVVLPKESSCLYCTPRLCKGEPAARRGFPTPGTHSFILVLGKDDSIPSPKREVKTVKKTRAVRMFLGWWRSQGGP